jgi:hypothetical protein
MATEALITPPGEVLSASVLTPKTVNRGKGNEKQQYGIVLLQADPEQDPTAKAFIGSLHKAFMDKFGGNAKYGPNGRPWKKETVVNPDGSETPTGLVRITFSRDLATRNGLELPPPIVQDSRNQAWPTNIAIGNGSVCRLAYSVYCWDNQDGGKGITLNLLAVRVLAHVPFVAGGVDAGVFGAPEEGVDVSTLAPVEQAAGDLFGNSVEGAVPWD